MNNAVCLYDVLVHGNVSLPVYFSFAMASSQGLALYLPEQQAWAPAYSMLKHFYNFAPPGSVRIHAETSTGEADLRALAFQQPGGDRVTVIAINSGETSRSFTVEIDGMAAALLEAVVSDQQQQFASLSASGSATFSLPAQSVATLVFEIE